MADHWLGGGIVHVYLLYTLAMWSPESRISSHCWHTGVSPFSESLISFFWLNVFKCLIHFCLSLYIYNIHSKNIKDRFPWLTISSPINALSVRLRSHYDLSCPMHDIRLKRDWGMDSWNIYIGFGPVQTKHKYQLKPNTSISETNPYFKRLSISFSFTRVVN